MSKPFGKGSVCVVVGGTMGLNKGKIVTVQSFQGEHSHHGRIWRCTGEGLVTEYGVVGIAADFAQQWLQPIDDDPLPNQTEKIDEQILKDNRLIPAALYRPTHQGRVHLS